jgi:hypothetical protein
MGKFLDSFEECTWSQKRLISVLNSLSHWLIADVMMDVITMSAIGSRKSL